MGKCAQDIITESCIYYISPAGPIDVKAETAKIADFLAMYQPSRQEHVKDQGVRFLQLFTPTKAQTPILVQSNRWFDCQGCLVVFYSPGSDKASPLRAYRPRHDMVVLR